MTDRSVVVRLRAEVAGFQSAMAAASTSTRGVASDIDSMQSSGSTALGRLTTSADTHKEAWSTAGTALLGFGAAAVAGVGLAIKAYGDFDARMAQVKTLSHANADDMNAMTQAALTTGQSIGFSANDVADAEIELVKAGASVKDMMGGALVGALNLAAAGQIDVGKATEIATVAMTQFKLKGSDIPHVADLLAAGADKALGGVQELGDGLKQGGLIASQFGLSIDDTVGTLSAFANAGLLGSDAGTSMKTMFLALASPSKQAQKALDEYNITAYDSQGKFIGVTALAGQLHDKLGSLSDAQRNAALSTIFGTDAMRSASVLMNEGAAGMAQWISDVNDQGFAAQQAAGKMNNMNGDLKKLQAAFTTGMIEMGQSADGFVRPIIQGLTGVVSGFNSLPEPVKGFGLAAAAAAGGVAVLAGGFLLLAPKVLDTINGMRTLAQDMPGLTAKLGSFGKAAGAAAAGLAAFTAAAAIVNTFEPATASVDATTQALIGMKDSTASVDALFKAFNNKGLAADGINSVGDALQRINNMNWAESISKGFNDISGGVMTDSLKAARDQLGKIDSSLSSLAASGNATAAAKSFKQIAEAAQQQGVSVEKTAKSFPGYLDALRNQASQAKVTLKPQELLDWAMGKVPASMAAAAEATVTYTDAAGQQQTISQDQAKALADVGLAADGTISSLDKLVTAMEAAGLIQLSANDALRNYYASLDAVDASIKKNGKSLDIHTEKGRANQAALDDVAKSGLAVVQANAKNGESQETLSKNLHTTYDDLIANYGAFGITGDKADAMARQVLGIPKDVSIDTAIQNFADTMAKAQQVKDAADAIAGPRNVTVVFSTDATGFYDPSAGTNGRSSKSNPNGGAGSGFLGKGQGAYASGGLIGFATGGMVGGFPGGGLLSGPGSGTSDSMIARVSNGEFIQPTKSVQKYGVHFMEQVRAGTYQPTAPTFQAAGNYSSSSAAMGSAPVTHIWNITGQENPVATTHEVLRRASALKV